MSAPFLASALTTKIPATTTSASSQLAQTAFAVRIYNSSTSIAFFKSGAGSATATTSDTPIAAGSVEVFTLPRDHNVVAVILSTGTGDVYFTPGEGL